MSHPYDNLSDRTMKEAFFYEVLENQVVRCHLCPHECRILDGQKGVCAVRSNIGGKLYTLVYDQVIAEHVDPIEKKPLFHFYPGSTSYSIATVGCNFRCRHCQNSDISQIPRDRDVIAGNRRTPDEIVSMARHYDCRSISFTYTEPTIYFEYACDTAEIAFRSGLKNVFVTNGYINPEPLRKIAPYLHAANIDLKAFSEEFYKNICGARLQPVLDAIRLYKQLGIWIEITTLIIPGHNDSETALQHIAAFIADVGIDIPWHVTAFYPTYRLIDRPRTSAHMLSRARDIGLQAGLRYVYTGNISGSPGENTYCPTCGLRLIQRIGFQIIKNDIVDACCPHCRSSIDGIGL